MYISLRFFVFLCLSILTVSSVSGQTSELAKIRIEGVNEELAANIRNHLAISAESCDTPLSRLNRLAPQVRTNIRNAANALGYYHSTFELIFSEPEECWLLSIDMVPRDQILVENVSVHIAVSKEDQLLFQEIIDELPNMEKTP